MGGGRCCWVSFFSVDGVWVCVCACVGQLGNKLVTYAAFNANPMSIFTISTGCGPGGCRVFMVEYSQMFAVDVVESGRGNR